MSIVNDSLKPVGLITASLECMGGKILDALMFKVALIDLISRTRTGFFLYLSS